MRSMLLRVRRLLGALLLAALLAPAGALASPCGPYTTGNIPDCELQQQAPVPYSALETQGWAYYCTGDHPYFWGLSSNYPGDFTWDNSCFSAIENVFPETTPNKFDATFTNWCLSAENIVVTLGCSSQPPPGFGPSCNETGDPVSDPGCPQSNISNHCSSTNPPVCFQTATETCSDGTTYSCTADQGIVWCYKCS
jgi:hypothetical protein